MGSAQVLAMRALRRFVNAEDIDESNKRDELKELVSLARFLGCDEDMIFETVLSV